MGRVSTFADAAVIDLANTRFVPVCTDDWYTRRRKDAEGDFFRAVADSAGRKGVDGATRQGIYVFTADGTLLGYKNAGQDAEVMKEVFRTALAKFDKLPKADVTVPPLDKPDRQFTRTPADGGLIVRVQTRILEKKDGGFVGGTCEFGGGDKSARDFLWLTADEVKQLAPAKTTVGESYPVPAAITARIARFHLNDNTRGEPNFWTRPQVRTNRMTLTVTEASDTAVSLRWDGVVLLATDADPARADRGYEAKLQGKLRWLPKAKTFDRFDVAAVGDHWGRCEYTPGDRPGRHPLGVAFGLADPKKPGDRIPPQGIREENRYWGKGE